MDNKIIYHGSNMKVEIPKIMINGYYKDFGYGFYCTNLKKQAIRWAMTKKGDSVINTYSYQRNENLQIKTFEEMTEEWLQFVVDCRRGIEHNYDIVEGPMADDQIWNYVEDYVKRRNIKRSLLGIGEISVSDTPDCILYGNSIENNSL